MVSCEAEHLVRLARVQSGRDNKPNVSLLDHDTCSTAPAAVPHPPVVTAVEFGSFPSSKKVTISFCIFVHVNVYTDLRTASLR